VFYKNIHNFDRNFDNKKRNTHIKMRIWKTDFTLEGLNDTGHQTMVSHLGIEFTEAGDDFLVARMPVDHRTVQPFGILHGGASVTLAETIGSVASVLCIDLSKQRAVGLEINASHLKGVPSGQFVFATVRPIRLGKTIHVWNIEIRNEKGDLNCVSRLTMAII
jgi:1,4-dihydroxy-2-naphthoyl-CoA hydrolase